MANGDRNVFKVLYINLRSASYEGINNNYYNMKWKTMKITALVHWNKF